MLLLRTPSDLRRARAFRVIHHSDLFAEVGSRMVIGAGVHIFRIERHLGSAAGHSFITGAVEVVRG